MSNNQRDTDLKHARRIGNNITIRKSEEMQFDDTEVRPEQRAEKNVHRPNKRKRESEQSEESDEGAVRGIRLRQRKRQTLLSDAVLRLTSKSAITNKKREQREKYVSMHSSSFAEESDSDDSFDSVESRYEKSKTPKSTSVNGFSFEEDSDSDISDDFIKSRYKSFINTTNEPQEESDIDDSDVSLKRPRRKSFNIADTSESARSDSVLSPQFENELMFDTPRPSVSPSVRRPSCESIPGKPKRPLSAYMLWLNTVREQIKQECPQLKFIQITRKAGRIWRAMKDKSEWIAKELYCKKLYEEALRQYAEDTGVQLKSLHKYKPKVIPRKIHKTKRVFLD